MADRLPHLCSDQPTSFHYYYYLYYFYFYYYYFYYFSFYYYYYFCSYWSANLLPLLLLLLFLLLTTTTSTPTDQPTSPAYYYFYCFYYFFYCYYSSYWAPIGLPSPRSHRPSFLLSSHYIEPCTSYRRSIMLCHHCIVSSPCIITYPCLSPLGLKIVHLIAISHTLGRDACVQIGRDKDRDKDKWYIS